MAREIEVARLPDAVPAKRLRMTLEKILKRAGPGFVWADMQKDVRLFVARTCPLVGCLGGANGGLLKGLVA